MQIRRLDPENALAFRAIRLEALRDSPAAFGSSYEEEAVLPLEVFAKRLTPGSDRTMFGAFVDTAIVGLAGVGREEGLKERHRALVRSMFVEPNHRRKGIGRQLVLHAFAFAQSMPGVKQITLAVTADNVAAVSLYEACGFREYGRAPEALFVNGEYHDEILMVKRLSTAEP
jgi:ribosomal protein S18 acetylase RimI-like enzyme